MRVAGPRSRRPDRGVPVRSCRRGELADRPVERRREEERLVARREALHDRVDLRLEAHVEHAVGLVEDEDLDRVHTELALLDQVLQAAGGGDQDVGAAGRCDLRALVDAAVDGGDAQAAGLRDAARAHRRPVRPAHGSARARGPTRGRWPARGSRRSGMPKARVLPEPVGDWASTSRPARTSGEHQGLDREWCSEAALGEGSAHGSRHAEIGERSFRHRSPAAGCRGRGGGWIPPSRARTCAPDRRNPSGARPRDMRTVARLSAKHARTCCGDVPPRVAPG